jgi:hypothetical protein
MNAKVVGGAEEGLLLEMLWREQDAFRPWQIDAAAQGGQRVDATG